MADTAEFFVMNEDELETRLTESRRELLNLRFQLATGQLDNPARVGQVRKEVARVLTVLRQRELEEADALAAEAWDAGTAQPSPAAATDAPAVTDVPATADAPATDQSAAESDVEEEG